LENLELIDGSAFAFLHANKENHSTTMREHLERLLDIHSTDKYVIFTEKSKSNFRLSVAYSKGYKENRQSNRDSVDNYLPYLNDCFRVLKEFGTALYLGIENVDAISISKNRFKNHYNTIICGDDSDLLSIEGDHYRLRRNESMSVSGIGSIEVNSKGKLIATGLYSTYSKIIKGSQKENYSGLKGLGDKAAYNLLKDLSTEEEMRDLCVDLFTQTFGYRDGIKKLDEGFRLCYLLKENSNFITPPIKTYNKSKCTNKFSF
jgi:5'-3' exonuclease